MRRKSDVVLPGPTAFDDHEAAPDAILAEWTTGRDDDARVANLRGTGGGPRANGDLLLKMGGPDVTVYDNTVVDVLGGAAGSERFFANASGGAAPDLINAQGGGAIVAQGTPAP